MKKKPAHQDPLRQHVEDMAVHERMEWLKREGFTKRVRATQGDRETWNAEEKLGFQVIQAVTFSSPNVGGHDSPQLKGSLNSPSQKRVTSRIARDSGFPFFW